MIEIIREGKIKYEATCKKCGCQFRFDVEDVTYRKIYDDHGGRYLAADFIEINCPCCNEKISLHEDNLHSQTAKMKQVEGWG